MRITRKYQEIPDTEFDHDQVAQVFLNLLLNARQAAKGDVVGITVGTRTVDGMVEVFVADDGQGIEEDALSRVFEPFFTTKGALGGGDQGGTGLGLSIALGIVKDHGGNIKVQSSAGEGSEFIVSFPISPGTRKERATLRVIVVDGDRFVASLNRDVLEGEGMRVEFGTVEDLLAPERMEGYSVLIIDPVNLDIPDLAGVLKGVVDKGIRVLLTPSGKEPQVRRLLQPRGIFLLDKPYTPQELSSKVKGLCAHGFAD